MTVVCNLVIWFIFLLPATLWWYNTMKMNYRVANSWADKVAVGIIALIFIATVVVDIAIILGICIGINVFDVP